MSPDDRDDLEDLGPELEPPFEDAAPRSVFASLWFRVVLVVIVLGVVAAVAVPYILEWMGPPPQQVTTLGPSLQGAPSPAAPPAASQPAAKPEPPPAQAATPTGPVDATPPATTAGATVPAPATAAKPKEEPPQGDKPKAAAKPSRRVAKATAPKAEPPKVDVKAQDAKGAYFVQLGAFKEVERANRLADKLRKANFTVEESTAPPASAGSGAARRPSAQTRGGDRYDVFVRGGSVADLSAKLTAKGLASQPSGDGVVVRPSLPLRDAVALSKDLAVEGLRVQVKRVGPASPPAGAAPAAAPGESLHRVRVGPFTGRAAALAALRDLEAKGYRGFIARGGG